ncbi:hypothetical protein V1477_001470 [Vespula maculifrons]|uniref:REJ domain-containing protein n=1 Tax=Vespula maculifrons TaxID=7453 RepID=A0ABD2CYS7_VESMC
MENLEGSIYTSPSFYTVLNEIELSFENLFLQFYKYLFNSSNITISYEAYSCTIRNKSFLSFSLSTLDKHPDLL